MSYRNYVRIKTYRALKKFQCFIHIFDLVYPQLAPSYIVNVKLLLLHMRAYACIAPFLNFHIFLFHLVLNYRFILKSSWQSWLSKSQSFVSQTERSEFGCYVLVFYSGSSYFTYSLLAVFCFFFFFEEKGQLQIIKIHAWLRGWREQNKRNE